MADYEVTICVVKQVFVFRVPPLTSAQGYRAADWNKDPIWTGRLRIVRKGAQATVLLEHTDKVGLFAGCPIVGGGNSVEPVSDSSRYFVLRVQDGKGGKACLGIGFNSRDEAFDFKVGLQTAEKPEPDVEPIIKSDEPPMDFSLKGPIKLGTHLDAKKKVPKPANGTASAMLPPPPSQAAKRPVEKQQQQHVDGKAEQDVLGLSGSSEWTSGDVEWATFD